MQFTETIRSNVTVVNLEGKVMGGDDLFELCGQLKKKFNSGRQNMIINLADVEWTNSCGLGMLISLHMTAARSGGRLALANADRIHRLLNLTRLDEVLDTYDTIEDALVSFEAEPYEPD